MTVRSVSYRSPCSSVISAPRCTASLASRVAIGPREAIYQACVLRFRPIMMTTAAALLGAVPLALGAGDGAELRQPLGIAIVGGLVMSQLLTLYTTPVVYLYIDRFRLWFMRLRGKTVTLQVAEGRP